VKRLFLALGGPVLLLLAGCSVSEESGDDVARSFQEGIHGQGHIVQPDQPASENAGRQTP
jgi:hypothetical protein